MKIISDITEYTSEGDISIALGTFDGVHKGHQEVINSAVLKQDAIPAVFTFHQSPAGVINGSMVRSITTQSTKQRIIESLGVSLFISPSFLSVKDMTPSEFVEMLVTRFKAIRICCGFNFKFGKDGEGNANILKQLCKEYNVEVCVIPPVVENDLPISSSRIRELISDGNIKDAEQLLGHPFGFDFEVIEGDHIGRTMDLPTINQKWPQNFVAPKYGVYATRTLINGVWYKSVSNIGVRPTIGSNYLRCETYILDYTGDLYGDKIYIELIDFLRCEQHFESIDELKKAIMNDVAIVENL